MQFKTVKPNMVIKNKTSGELYLVVDKNSIGLLVTNLMLRYNPSPVLMLYPRDSDNWKELDDVINLDI